MNDFFINNANIFLFILIFTAGVALVIFEGVLMQKNKD